MPPLNLSKTQKGYVPLVDRFKSFPKDSEKEPVTDSQFYFQNYANGTLEKATLDLLFPVPDFITKAKNKAGIEGAYIVDNEGTLLIGTNHYVVGVEAKNGS